ncbi:MAG: hypothetical protein WC621_03835 [Patescibacteria group bacterium]
MKPLLPNHRKVMIATTALTITATLGLLAFIIGPSLREILNLSDQIYQQRIDLEKLYRKGKILKQTLKDYQTIKPTVGQFNSIYVERGNELNLITAMEKVASDHTVDQEIIIGTPDIKGDKNSLPIQLQVNAPLANLLKYLGGLEQMDYYLNIQTLRVSKYSARSNAPAPKNITVSAILLGSVYYRP